MTQLKYCLYARKSSESDERQALSIDSQITEMKRLAAKESVPIVETIKESKSAKASGVRIGYQQLLEGLREQRFNAILTWAPDRLSRNAGDLGKLVDLMDQKLLIKIRTHGQSFTNTPDEKFLLMILCSQAKLENDNRAKNVKRGLRKKCEMGIRPGGVPLGYKLVRSENFKDPSTIEIDEERAPFIKRMFHYIAQDGLSGRQVWEYMIDEGFRTKKDKPVSLSMVFRILAEPFYYGRFEFPKGSGNWYQGSHQPIITKAVFEKVRTKMKVPPKSPWGRKSFFFNEIFKCGCCNSGITGEEKINRHGKRYVYYRCNRVKGKKFCKEKYIRETKLIESLTLKISELKSQHVRLNQRIKDDLSKINRYRLASNPLSVHEYIAGILRDGSKKEKSDILRSFRNRLFLRDGGIIIS